MKDKDKKDTKTTIQKSKEEEEQELPLNPDEGDKLKPVSKEKGKETASPSDGNKGSTSQGKQPAKAKLVDDSHEKSGKEGEPILLDDIDDEETPQKDEGKKSEVASKPSASSQVRTTRGSASKSTAKPASSASKKRKAALEDEDEDANKATRSKKVARKGKTDVTASATADKAQHIDNETDDQGNEKLTNFFEIKDDSD